MRVALQVLAEGTEIRLVITAAVDDESGASRLHNVAQTVCTWLSLHTGTLQCVFADSVSGPALQFVHNHDGTHSLLELALAPDDTDSRAALDDFERRCTALLLSTITKNNDASGALVYTCSFVPSYDASG